MKAFVYQIYIKLFRKYYLYFQSFLLYICRHFPRKPQNRKFGESIKLNNSHIACILDEFSYSGFKYEAECELLDSVHYKEQMMYNDYDVFLMENTWKGVNGGWKADLPQTKSKIVKIIHICRKRGIPTVFWNKDDPVHFKLFLPIASLFDYVFTTDEDKVNIYKEMLGHERVFLLQFAAQPKIHNPILKAPREDKACFAGTYYQHKYPLRGAVLNELLEASAPFGLDIYDRNILRNDKRYIFPTEFQEYVQGQLSHLDMSRAYASYKVGLNINSVQDSPTMFSRRVFELLACGTPVLSNYSVGIENTFRDIVKFGSDRNSFAMELEKLYSNYTYYKKTVNEGLREVHRKHTYKHRLQTIMEIVGYRVETEETKIIVVSCAQDKQTFDNIKYEFAQQDYLFKELVALQGSYQDETILSLDLQGDQVHNAYFTFMDGQGSYGDSYLTDLALAANYSYTEAIGVNGLNSYTIGTSFNPKFGICKSKHVVDIIESGIHEVQLLTYYIDNDYDLREEYSYVS